MNDLYTIIYYTSNRENEVFESKIKDYLTAVCGDIPIVSVSQKPIDFGTNICVGEVGACDFNLFRQIQLGCKEATTPYVISCEADCIYPPDYFLFTPPDESDYYRFTPLYILEKWGTGEFGGFYPKNTAPFGQITKREYWLSELGREFTGQPEWMPNGSKYHLSLFTKKDWKEIRLDNPIVNLKTGDGMRKHTQIKGEVINKISYWGDAEALRKELWH